MRLERECTLTDDQLCAEITSVYRLRKNALRRDEARVADVAEAIMNMFLDELVERVETRHWRTAPVA